MKKRVLILGSTGSIGVNSLKVLDSLKEKFEIAGISANSSYEKLAGQVREYNPGFVCIGRPCYLDKLKNLCGGNNNVKFFSGDNGIIDLLNESSPDLVINSLVGGAGLLPTIKALKAGAELALANKESLVMGGNLVMDLVKKNNSFIRPIDSEHSAIWQCLTGEKHKQIRRLILTASGGPFRELPREKFSTITPEQALKHPNWNMGSKITIDSSTMMNKGLEIIEARWLFDIPEDKIDVVVHPQSIIHSMVEFADGSIKAQLGYPDMKLPIQYSLTYPERIDCLNIEIMDFCRKYTLTFEPVDNKKFPAVLLAGNALKTGGSAPAVLNAANEEAVQLFLDYNIKYTEIISLVDCALQEHTCISRPSLGDILEADKWAREFIKNKAKNIC